MVEIRILYTAKMTGEGPDEGPESSFARVKMVGAEFDGGRIPVRSLNELMRYQALVLAAASDKWLEDHDGEDLPDDFEARFELILADVEDGSAVSVLEMPVASGYDSFYEYGRSTVEDQIALAATETPDAEAISLLAYREFREFGSSLREDESIEIGLPEPSGHGSRTVTVTPAVSQRIAKVLTPAFKKLQKPERRTELGWLVGRLTAINADEKNYTIASDEHGSINGRYRDDEILDDLKAVLDSSERAPVVRLYGRLRYAEGRLLRVLDIAKVQVLEIDGEPWSRRFIELARLVPGWDEDDLDSDAVSFAALDGAREVLHYVRTLGAGQPGIFPTAAGGVSVEWATSSEVITVEVTDDAEFQLFHIANGANAIDTGTKSMADVRGFLEDWLKI